MLYGSVSWLAVFLMCCGTFFLLVMHHCHLQLQPVLTFSKRKQNVTQLHMHIKVYVDLFYFLELDIFYICIRLLTINNYDYVAYVRISCINVCADVITVFILFCIVHLVIF
jgi:hypothetical protein